MAKDDWFRNTTWSDSIQEAFFTRLKRARSQRDQYIAIQALTLVDRHPETTLELVDFYFETRKSTFDDGRALEARAEAHLRRGNLDLALAAYRDVLAHEREHPGFTGTAFVDYPYLVATNGVEAAYEGALEELLAHAEEAVFPIHRFKWFAAAAIISDSIGERELARQHARHAIEAAEATESPFPRHRHLGLVGSSVDDTVERLRQIAG